MRTFSGSDQFKEMSNVITKSYSNIFPVEKNGHKLELEHMWLDDSNVDPKDYTSQKKTKLAGGTWGANLNASLVLRDHEGKILDRMEKVRLATIPRVTPRGSYIVGGNEYQVANQMIRKTGAYVVRSQKGENKGMIALGGERTNNFEIHFDPASNKYTAKIGQANIPLYPLLKSLGATDPEMEKSWGKEIFAANKSEKDNDYLKLANKLARVDTDNKQTAIDAIQAYAKSTKIDPTVTELTVGKKHDSLNQHLLLDTSKKILHTYQGKAEPDDPENLLFKEIRSVEDMLEDKLGSKKEQDSLKKMLSRHLGKRTEIKKIIDFKKLTSPVESFFTSDNRTSTPEQYNPVHMVAEQNKLTIHGTGGITSSHAVSASLREVHPSHIGFVDPIFTPESEKTGTTLHLASATIKDGRSIRTFVRNNKTGDMELLSPQELYFKTVAFPDEMKNGKFVNTASVKSQNQGKVIVVPASQVDYVLPEAAALFSHSTNLVPFLKNDQGNRAMMAAKMLGQALPLVEREAPNVQTEAIGGKTTFHNQFGEHFSIRATRDGKVTEIKPDYMKIGDEKIPLYNNFPLNQKTAIHHEVLVHVGDTVKKGQLIADSNFTKGGTLALGKNLNVAYLAYPGLTFEDGIVVTESGAKKLSAEQNYPYSFSLEPGRKEVNFKRFLGYYPNTMTKEMVGQYDGEGVIKKGAKVKPGQILIAGLTSSIHSPENMTLKRINKALMLPWSNSSVTYSGEYEGTVTDIVKRGDEIKVFVKAIEPARESDKLSGVHGNKGVITKVIPDSEAPRTKEGKIPDVLLNPHGIIGRINLGQIYESAAGKIAEKTGKPYIVKNFDHEDTSKKIVADLKKHGINDEEEMFTPEGKSLGKVHIGNPYILRLAKTGKAGFSARMPGSGYDVNLQPVKGGEEGTKQLDLLTFYSMLSHGAKKTLIDAHQKSEKNDEYWHAIEMNRPLPAPKPTFAFDKFTSLLRGAGINTEKKGTDFVLAPMTDKDVLKISKGRITEPEFLYGKNLQEKKGGFFDTTITGGIAGKNYGHIELPERMPNPVFEGAIKSLTGLKQAQYDGIVSGKMFVGADGKVHSAHVAGAKTGGEGIATLLKQIDVDSSLAKFKSQIKKTKQDSDIDALNRKIRYLSALKDLNMDPVDAYTRKTVAVIPPVFRPIQEIAGRGLQVAPSNILYQNVGILAKSHDYPVMKLLGDEDKAELREQTYKSTRALAGLEPVMTRGKSQPIEGFISQITGTTPKQGFFLNKLVTKRQDLVGRGVITNGPELHVDELGIPEKMAWSIFHPFIVREFTMSGYKPDDARKQIEQKTDVAKKMLQVAMEKRTVMMNRAPSLHKFSIMAFKPKLSDGLAIRVPPLVFKGFNADVDGDAVSIHVPTSEEAVKESVKMFPSNNLWKPGTGELMLVPSQESAIGLYFMSQTPAGREKINKILPAQYKVTGEMSAKAAKILYDKIAKEDPQQFPNIVHQMKLLGDQHAYDIGFTSGLKDIHVDTKIRDQIFKKADTETAALKKSMKPGLELDNKVAGLYEKAAQESYKHMKEQLKAGDSSFYHMIASGARGKDSQLMQLISAPGIVLDAKDRKVPVPIKKSYAEGISTSDYFMSSYGVRKGMMDRALQTSQPGALNKDIMASVVDNVITVEDCGTHKGISLPVSSSDVYDRYLARDQNGYQRNAHVTPQIVSDFTKKGVKTIEVRSPLRCIALKGTCAYCYGNDEHGKLPVVGENVGAKMGQTMSEPVTQMVMRCTVSNIAFKYRDKFYVRSMEDIWNIVEGDIVFEGDKETKFISDAFVLDQHRWVPVECVQRHKPDCPVHFLKTKSGDAVLVQADHPIFVFSVPECECGHKHPITKHENKGYTTTECPTCKRVKTYKKSELTATEVVKNVVDVCENEDYLWVVKNMPKCEVTKESTVPGYLAGMYLAEGCLRYKEETPVAILLSQFEGSIQNKIFEETQAAGYNSFLHEKEVAIYDLALAKEFEDLMPGLAHEKRMNFDFYFHEDEYLADLLAGLIDGDGTIAKRHGNAHAKIYSSSFILIQQVSMICQKLGIKYNINMCAKSDTGKAEHKAQPYVIELRIDMNGKYLLRKSIKISSEESYISRYEKDDVKFGPSLTTINKPIETEYDFYTYDVKTTTQSFMAGFIRNHNTFHSGGVSTGAPQASGFQRVSQLLNMPKYIPAEAALAPVTGKVTKIVKAPAGGFHIHVGDTVATSRPGLTPKVAVGDSVKIGDTLTDGVIKPQNLLKHKGMYEAQNYIVDELQKTFKDQGVPMHRKVFETVMRSVANNTRVIEAPKHTDFVPGDVIPYTTALHYNETRKLTVPVADSIGYRTKEIIGKLPQFHEITDKDVPYLRAMGYNDIEVVKDPLIHAPMLKGITQLPMLRKDWMAQLGYRYINQALTEGAAQSWKSNVEGTHPIPAFAYGASFGKKKEHY